ncbi:hypothetical protein G210_2799 [Candida maltosa Xu316]|uniref:Uncharacterized protein n=1 Tax=Candida maltosa (strain Xu316) TaxID=1245528 RepID=M3HHZ0_CANMX|nr:hypothetical protein G210_2799 [Candida maltosa Xu316]
MNRKRVSWAEPIFIDIDSNVPTNTTRPTIYSTKSILKPTRVTPFPFIEEIPIDPNPDQTEIKIKISRHDDPSTTTTTKKVLAAFLWCLNILFFNRLSTTIVNLLVALIGFISLGVLKLVADIGRVLVDLNYAAFIDFFQLLLVEIPSTSSKDLKDTHKIKEQ